MIAAPSYLAAADLREGISVAKKGKCYTSYFKSFSIEMEKPYKEVHEDK